MNEIQQPTEAASNFQGQGISKEEAVQKLREAQERRISQAPSLSQGGGALGGNQQQPSPAAANAQAPTQEDKDAVKKVEQAQASGSEENFARQFAALTREQRALFAQKEAMKKDMEEVGVYKKRQELKKTDIAKYLEEEGLDPDSVLKAYLNKGEGPQVDDRVAALEKVVADYQKEKADGIEQARLKDIQEKEKAVIDNFKKQMNDFINASPDQYETIIADGASDLVFDRINKHFEETQEILPFEVVADEIENQLFERAKKLTGLKKLSSFLVKKEVPQDRSQQQQNQRQDEPQSFSQTLTSDFTPVSAHHVPDTLDGEVLKQRALEKLRAKQRQFS